MVVLSTLRSGCGIALCTGPAVPPWLMLPRAPWVWVPGALPNSISTDQIVSSPLRSSWTNWTPCFPFLPFLSPFAFLSLPNCATLASLASLPCSLSLTASFTSSRCLSPCGLGRSVLPARRPSFVPPPFTLAPLPEATAPVAAKINASVASTPATANLLIDVSPLIGDPLPRGNPIRPHGCRIVAPVRTRRNDRERPLQTERAASRRPSHVLRQGRRVFDYLFFFTS